MLTAGSIVALVFFVISIGVICVAIWAFRKRAKGDDWLDTYGFVAWTASAVGALMLVPVLIGTFPWLPQYHVLETHAGKVVKVEARIITDGSKSANLTKEMAFWLEGETNAYHTTDLRLNGLKAGQTLTVQRWDTWVYGGQNYWQTLYVSAPEG